MGSEETANKQMEVKKKALDFAIIQGLTDIKITKVSYDEELNSGLAKLSAIKDLVFGVIKNYDFVYKFDIVDSNYKGELIELKGRREYYDYRRTNTNR